MINCSNRWILGKSVFLWVYICTVVINYHFDIINHHSVCLSFSQSTKLEPMFFWGLRDSNLDGLFLQRVVFWEYFSYWIVIKFHLHLVGLKGKSSNWNSIESELINSLIEFNFLLETTIRRNIHLSYPSIS